MPVTSLQVARRAEPVERVAQVLANDQATLDAVLRAFEAFQQMLTDVYQAGSTPASR